MHLISAVQIFIMAAPPPHLPIPMNSNLHISPSGLAVITQEEGSIDGLYDDPSGYATFGVGHLVHHRGRWASFLLRAARAMPAFANVRRDEEAWQKEERAHDDLSRAIGGVRR